ncbi:hypothetical protein SAMN05444267_10843 [Chryseobacterium polytrichastri]|uniref:Uncharacterized protein n=1 Tax=Chryseobacterium polytrichastri TaxID=1302687 RepID=A0A1M7L6M5_9FLAO|nr:hypothetical protein SAMN05444267_10843 [Chryseobacterium polytrichastri]
MNVADGVMTPIIYDGHQIKMLWKKNYAIYRMSTKLRTLINIYKADFFFSRSTSLI